MYPSVDTTQFIQSAKTMQKLMKEANTIVNEIATNRTFSKQLMEKAQQSKQDDVVKLLQTLGIESTVTVSFNPNTIHITLTPKKGEAPCCKLTFFLYWR